jgi:drug/metabolite transporter (DMT)-like permease
MADSPVPSVPQPSTLKLQLALAWVTLVWGTGWLAIKVTLDSFAPLFLAGSRYVGAAALLLLLVRASGATLPRGRAEWATLLGTGALMTGVCPGLVFWGQARVPSGLASLLFAAMPLVTALMANQVLPGERLTRARLGGILVGLAGVAIVCASGLGAGSIGSLEVTAPGALAVIGGAVVFSAGLVWMKAAGHRFHPLVAVAFQSIAGAAVLLPVALVFERDPIRALGPGTVAMYAYLTIVQSGLTQCIWIWLVNRVAATRIAYISCIVPAIAVAAGALALGEPVGWSLAVGGAAITAGLLLVNRAG